MKPRFIALAAGGALLAACGDPATSPVPTRALGAAVAPPGDYVVTFQSESEVPASFAADVEALGGRVASSVANTGIVAVSGLSDAAAATLAKRSDVLGVGRDFTVSVVPQGGSSFESEELSLGETLAESSPEAIAQSQSAPETASQFPRQWNMRAIGANKAWAANKLGSPDVTVAIVDGGIDYKWPDLDGLVDLSRSVSFVPEDDALVRQYFPTRHPVTDLYLHGTAVASIVSSKAGRFAGVTSRVTLIGVKVIGLSGETHVSKVLQGIVYAADHGADVANVSLGDAYMRDSVRGAISAINRAMNYAHRKGMTVVVAAGNDAIDADHDGNEFVESCNAPNVICVSATGPTAAAGAAGPWTNVDAFASYSNYGRSMVDVAAPGGGTATNTKISVPCSTSSLAVPACRTGLRLLTLNGTSLAAPHVAGLAALLVEKLGRDPSAIRDALLTLSDDLGEGGTDPYYGKGRVNVARALGLP